MDFEELSCGVSLSPITLHLTLVVLVMFVACTPVEGQPQVIGSLQPIVAAPGDDVILPCHVEPQFNVVGLTVEWSKPDLKPDPNDRLSRVDYVYLYRDTQEVTDMQIPSYTRRTALFRDRLRQGNISLKITNVTLADEGRYRCFIPKLKSRANYSIVLLVVEPNSTKTSTTETPLQPRHHPTPDPKEGTGETDGVSVRSRVIPVVVVVLLVVLGVGVTVYLTHKRHKQEKTPKAQGFRPASVEHRICRREDFKCGAHLQLVDVSTSTAASSSGEKQSTEKRVKSTV